ncbi:MAG: decaprenyl-phosphate phosphoribosyltransferase [Kiloniellales bacterium]|nr:decaprenyl-phosphate phosphoribosyltransferase [Kiloniellales bacterium]
MTLPPLLALMRPQQWVKNAFVAAPLFFTPPAFTTLNLLVVLGGIVSFSLLSSAVYIVNDYMDREADRAHPAKAKRPLAAGTVSPGQALGLLVLVLAVGFALAFALSLDFALVGALYVAINLGYSTWLKNFAIVDVMLIGFSFVLRVKAGAHLIEIEPSAWIMIVTGLLALFLALAKRRDDLVRSLDENHRRSLNGYSPEFLDIAVAVVLGAMLVAYMVYTTDRQVMAAMGTERLFYTVPFVIAGILRYLQITLVEKRSGSPTAMVMSDRFLLITILLWAGTFAVLIHG